MNLPNIPPVTDKEQKRWPKHGLVKLEKPFIDARGEIQPLVDEMMRSAVLIESKAGSIRANHYHKTDWHYCYVLSGEIKYFYRPHGDNEMAKELIIRENQMFFTPPMIEHAMVFEKATQFLTWSRNSRIQEIYETDVCRIAPINP